LNIFFFEKSFYLSFVLISLIDFILLLDKFIQVLKKKLRKHLRKTNDSHRVDEPYIKVKGQWKYRYRAVDKNAAYPPAIDELKEENLLPKTLEVRQIKYLNNIVGQDHRGIKSITNPMMGFKSLRTAKITLAGIQAMQNSVLGFIMNPLTKAKFTNTLFELTA
jgi:IS6 family transposase